MANNLQVSVLRRNINGSYCHTLRRFNLINTLLSRKTPSRTFALAPDDAKEKERPKDEGQFMNSTQDDNLDEEAIEAQIMAKRDVSRLPDHLKRKLYHLEKVPRFIGLPGQLGRDYKRTLYGHMGKKSAVHPSLFYPFEDELGEMKEERQLFEPSLEQLIASAQAKVDERERERKEREELVLKQMAKMPKLIEEYKKNLRLKEDHERVRLDKAKALLDEARDYFGYDIDRYDPRFEKMVEEKQELEKAEKRKRKKEERQAESVAKLLELQEMAKKQGELAKKEEEEKEVSS